MKIEDFSKVPKQDLDDYTEAEQELIMLMGGIRARYKTDYMGIEKAITVRLDCRNAPKVEAYSELSGLSKNIVINRFLSLAFHVLNENLNEEDREIFFDLECKKNDEWLSELGVR